MTAEQKLYVIRIPGPEEVYAAPSLRAAELMKAAHDKTMSQWLADKHAKNEMRYLTLADVSAIIEEWDDAKEHAEMLAGFSYTDWQIAEADLAEPEDAPQAQLFPNEGGAA